MKAYDEYMKKIDAMGKLSNASDQLKALIDMESFINNLYNKGHKDGYNEGYSAGEKYGKKRAFNTN